MMFAPAVVRCETVILQLQVLEGEGGVFAASGRALKPATVRVTDETGAPIAGAAVSFRLPEEGVTGIFQNGLKTDLVLSGPDGRAVSPGITWGPLTGPAKLRITAAVAEARAGVLVPVYVSPGNVVVAGASPSMASLEPRRIDPATVPRLKKQRRWVRWVAAAAIGIGTGVVIAFAGHSRGAGGGSTAAAAGPPISIGAPSISVGRIP